MADAKARLTTALAGRYQIERELGQGGMATVYLALDLRHDRKVALKVLKPELAAVLGAERFVVEIKTTAALQHPHILPLFDSGSADGFLYYVMPFIDGETLRAKLDRETQLGVEEAVRIAVEVADALDYAHQHGVIHRDIKPENILLANGRPMVADFGIALAVSAAAGGRMTETGLSLGTPHYMSPEQATADKEISARSDIYSLASVLYEMLTGEPPHMGNSAQQIIMKIIADTPRPVAELRKSVPPNVAAAVERALEKLPADRFETARRFQEALTNPGFARTATGVTATGGRPRGVMAAAGWAVALVATLAFGWSRFGGPRPGPEPSTRFAFSFGNEATGDLNIAISPDGRRIFGPGRSGLLMRDLGEVEPKVLPTGAATRPAVSPDGRWVTYQEGSVSASTRKILIEGGTPIDLSECDGTVWLDLETMVCRAGNWGIGRASSAGGPVELLTKPDTAAGEIGHWSAAPLPGGRALLFTSYRRPVSRIEALDLKTGRRVVVAENGVRPVYAKSGHVLFVRDSTLFAVRFDPVSLRPQGPPVPVLTDVASKPSDAVAGVAIADNGTLVVVRQSLWWVDTRIVWVGRDGREEPAIPKPGALRFPRLSPDRQRILVTVGRDGGSRDLWLYDLRREAFSQITRSQKAAFGGVWTPDGRQVAFTNESPSYDLYRVPIDGSEAPRPLVSNILDKYPRSVSPDGHEVAYEENWITTGRIRVASLDSAAPGRIVGDSTVELADAQFSPDGRWIAASLTARGANPHIVVFRADGTPGTLPASSGEAGDTDPRWTRGGRELVFRRGTAVYAVDIDPGAGVVGKEHELFDGGYPAEYGYDVTADGNRFLMVRTVDRPGVLPILVITNFFDELRRKAGN